MADITVPPIYRIMDLHESERPRERLAALGPQALSNAELIAILLRVGVTGENAVQVGQRLLNKFGGLSGLHRAPFKELMDQHGLGEAKASQIKAAIERADQANVAFIRDQAKPRVIHGFEQFSGRIRGAVINHQQFEIRK